MSFIYDIYTLSIHDSPLVLIVNASSWTWANWLARTADSWPGGCNHTASWYAGFGIYKGLYRLPSPAEDGYCREMPSREIARN